MTDRIEAVEPWFYDVPCVLDVTKEGPAGPLLHPPRMRYAIFSCPFEAMSYASRNRHLSPGGPLQVCFRPWSQVIFDQTRITDLRGIERLYALRNRDGTYWTADGPVSDIVDAVHFQNPERGNVRLDPGQTWEKFK